MAPPTLQYVSTLLIGGTVRLATSRNSVLYVIYCYFCTKYELICSFNTFCTCFYTLYVRKMYKTMYECHIQLAPGQGHHYIFRAFSEFETVSIVGLGYVCSKGQQSVCHGLAGFNLQFLTGTLKCVPGEFHLGYVMTSCLVHCTYILPVVYQMARCLFRFYDCEW